MSDSLNSSNELVDVLFTFSQQTCIGKLGKDENRFILDS